MAKKGKAGCSIKVGDAYEGYRWSYPFGAGGWGRAVNKARSHSTKTGRLSTIDIVCDDGSFAVAQCNMFSDWAKARCGLEVITTEGDVAVAGRRRRRRR
jgi:hypothetical protein